MAAKCFLCFCLLDLFTSSGLGFKFDSGGGPNHCACSAKLCTCCAEVNFTEPIIIKDLKVCAKLQLIDSDSEIEFAIELNNNSVFNQEFNISSFGKLSEQCASIPGFQGIEGCFELNNFKHNDTYIGACGSIDIKDNIKTIVSGDIGCWGLSVTNKEACAAALLNTCKGQTGKNCISCYDNNEDALVQAEMVTKATEYQHQRLTAFIVILNIMLTVTLEHQWIPLANFLQFTSSLN